MCRLSALFLLFHTAAASDLFSCAFSNFTLAVDGLGNDWVYEVFQQDTPWLTSDTATFASLALMHNGSLLTPGNGLTAGPPTLGSGEDELGPFTFLSVPWALGAASGAAPFFANFTCYERALAAFSLHFPGGYAFGAPQGADAAARFPLFFAAGENSTLLSNALGFVEWAGEMDSYENAHGVGLQGYGGGTQSGPLLLFNTSELVPGAAKPHALMLGPGGGEGTHVAHGVLNLLPAAAHAAGGAAPACDPATWAPHTDEVGANPAQGFEGGIMVAQGQPGQCCTKSARTRGRAFATHMGF